MTSTFVVFAVIAVVLPGPDLGLVVAQAFRSQAAGLKAALGIATGLLVHTAFATVGVTAIVVAVPNVLDVLQILGGVVLVAMGAGMLRSPPVGDAEHNARQAAASSASPWLVGVVVNLANPKTWIAFLSVFPVLLRPNSSGSLTTAMLVAGLTLAGMAALWYSLVVVATSRWATRPGTPTTRRWPPRLAGAVLALLGGVSLFSALT